MVLLKFMGMDWKKKVIIIDAGMLACRYPSLGMTKRAAYPLIVAANAWLWTYASHVSSRDAQFFCCLSSKRSVGTQELGSQHVVVWNFSAWR